MAFTIPPWVAYAASWAAIIAGVYLLFEKGEDVLTHETKAAVRNWIRKFYLIRGPNNWSCMFLLMFDGLFGSRLLSVRRMVNSCVASLMSVVCMTILWSSLRPDEALSFFREDTLLSQLLYIVSMAVILNLIPDYLSLAETRVILVLISKSRSISHSILYLVMDLILTLFIFLLGYLWLLSYIFINLILGWGAGISDFLDITLVELLYSLREWITLSSPPIGVFFYSTFITSIWIYIYILSAFIAYLVTKILPKAHSIIGLFDIDNKPIRSLGYVSILIVTCIFVTMPIIGWVVSHI